MPIERAITNGWTAVAQIRRWNGAAWVPVSFVREWTGAEWQTRWPATGPAEAGLKLTLGEVTGVYDCSDTVEAPSSCPRGALVESAATTASFVGGTGQVTYNWTFVSGNSGIQVSNASDASVTFSSFIFARDTIEAVWRCTATRGALSASADVVVRLSYNYSRGGMEP